jgi:hypothetical protein
MTLRSTVRKNDGFSIFELIIAMALGLLLLGAANQLFNSAVKTTALVSNRTEMQENARAAMDLIAKDVSMAGSGLPPGGIQLPSGTGSSLSRFACDQTGVCYVTTNTYPVGTVGTVAPTKAVSNFMFGITPGFGKGMKKGGPTTIAATSRTPDSITVAYVDYGFPLNQFTGAFSDMTGTKLTLTAPVPQPAATPNATDPGVGIKVGDLLMVSAGGVTAVGEVSVVSPLATSGATVTFTNGDALNINQTGASNNSMPTIVPAGSPPPPAPPPPPPVTVWRILVVTYYVEVPAIAGTTPRLMRQVNGNLPQPVADNIIDMQFSYDMCDPANAPPCAGIRDPLAVNLSPGQIHKVNIQLMTQSLASNSRNTQNMQLSTSVSARNMNYTDTY